jgi:hypothetical protein
MEGGEGGDEMTELSDSGEWRAKYEYDPDPEMYLAVAHYANMREGTIAGTPEELEAAKAGGGRRGGRQSSTEGGEVMRCTFCGREDFAGCRGVCGPWEYDPPIDLEKARRGNLHAERISRECWRDASTRRAQTRVALAGFRAARQKAAKVTL